MSSNADANSRQIIIFCLIIFVLLESLPECSDNAMEQGSMWRNKKKIANLLWSLNGQHADFCLLALVKFHRNAQKYLKLAQD